MVKAAMIIQSNINDCDKNKKKIIPWFLIIILRVEFFTKMHFQVLTIIIYDFRQTFLCSNSQRKLSHKWMKSYNCIFFGDSSPCYRMGTWNRLGNNLATRLIWFWLWLRNGYWIASVIQMKASFNSVKSSKIIWSSPSINPEFVQYVQPKILNQRNVETEADLEAQGLKEITIKDPDILPLINLHSNNI